MDKHGRCDRCRGGRHLWGPPQPHTYVLARRDKPWRSGATFVRLDRYSCFCRTCLMGCMERIVHCNPDPPAEIDLEATIRLPLTDPVEPLPVRPVAPVFEPPPGKKRATPHQDLELLDRVLRGLKKL